MTYASGARGGNVFLTKYSASCQHMLIKWADIQAKQDDNGEKYFLLRIRKEKKAKRHVDSFHQSYSLEETRERYALSRHSP